MPDKVLHVSHTDVTIDSRILKELNVRKVFSTVLLASAYQIKRL